MRYQSQIPALVYETGTNLPMPRYAGQVLHQPGEITGAERVAPLCNEVSS
jgi:hypothetical protein